MSCSSRHCALRRPVAGSAARAENLCPGNCSRPVRPYRSSATIFGQLADILHQVVPRMTSMTVLTSAQASGPPPNVVPRSPGPVSPAMAAVGQHHGAARKSAGQRFGCGQYIRLDSHRSGKRTVRRSGPCRSAPHRRSAARHALAQRPRGRGQTPRPDHSAPARPCTSSTITAAVSPVILPAISATSLRSMKSVATGVAEIRTNFHAPQVAAPPRRCGHGSHA